MHRASAPDIPLVWERFDLGALGNAVSFDVKNSRVGSSPCGCHIADLGFCSLRMYICMDADRV